MVLRRLLPLLSPWALIGAWSAPAHSAEVSELPSPSWISVTRGAGAEACPDQAQMQALAERLLPDSSPDVQVEVAFSHQSGTFVAEITRPQRSGIRRLSDSHTDCSALASAVATVLALLIDNESGAAVPTDPPAPVARQAPPSTAKTEDSQPDEVSHPSDVSKQSAGIYVAGGVSLAYFDEATPLVDAGLFYQVKRLRISLGLLHLFSKRTPLEPGTLAHQVTAGGATLCLRVFGNARLGVSPCVGTFVGVLVVKAEGFTENSQETRPWIAFPAGLTASGRFVESRNFDWGWRVGASALFASRQEEFVIEGIGVGLQTGRISAVLNAGLEGSFDF